MPTMHTTFTFVEPKGNTNLGQMLSLMLSSRTFARKKDNGQHPEVEHRPIQGDFEKLINKNTFYLYNFYSRRY